MTLTCLVEEDGHTRRFEAADFPLALGGRDADVEVPGLEGDEPAAFLALHDGELFAQPRGPVPVSIGGRPITASQWLRDGDEVRILRTRLHVVWRADRKSLQVRHLSLEPPVETPVLVVPAVYERAAESDALVHPAEYRPRPLPLGARPRAVRRLPLGRLALVLVALLATGFVFAARAIEVHVEPEPERLSVRGLPHLSWGGRRLLLPGDYVVRAEREGYRPLEARLAVTTDRNQVARFVMERLPGRVRVDTNPANGVRLFVDGKERGTTPLAPLEVAAGEHEVSLRAEGYTTFTTRLSVAGGGTEQTLRATLAPDRAPVSFTSAPAEALVRVDGAEVGRTPLTVELSSGTRNVALTLAGHRPAARTITVAPRKEHALRLTKAGHEAAQARVTLDLDEERSLSLALAPRMGDVEVAAEPPDAEVLVDGEVKGRVGQTLKLTATAHEIEVRRSGYTSHKVTITPRPDFPQSVKVRLRSLSEPKPAGPSRLSVQGHEMRLLAPGRFQMGASRREPGRRANETLREVELRRPSYLSVREVTNAQFRRFQAAHSSGTFSNRDLDADAQPVVRVTWEEAAAYCNWLSAQEGLPPVYVMKGGKLVASTPIGTGFRLPTEAEWSRAARYPEGGALKYPWGSSLPVPPASGNYADQSARSVVSVVLQDYDDHFPVSSPVGSFRPNALGFFDLGGNVAEWVHDVYSIPPADGPLEKDPVGPAEGDLHVILGSSYLHGTVSELRLSYRDYASKPRADVGFRIARYAE
jgi:formylglycine-generating enzyme required for sulfatase activity